MVNWIVISRIEVLDEFGNYQPVFPNSENAIQEPKVEERMVMISGSFQIFKTKY